MGRSWGRTLVEHHDDNPKGRLVGMVDSEALAREIVDAVNAARDQQDAARGPLAP